MSASSGTLLAPTNHQHPSGAPWSFAAASAYLGISERHLARLADEERVKSFKLGRRRFIADADLRALAEGR